jgi:hypothetical protein
MGSSFVAYKEFGFWTRDQYLSAWLIDLIHGIEEKENSNTWQTAIEKWREKIEINGGVMELSLDRFIESKSQETILISLSEKVLESCKPEGYRTGQLFISLLKGELKTTDSSPIDYF